VSKFKGKATHKKKLERAARGGGVKVKKRKKNHKEENRFPHPGTGKRKFFHTCAAVSTSTSNLYQGGTSQLERKEKKK